MIDICCIGHITLDKIVTPQNTVYMPGGTSYYFSYGMYHLNKNSNYKLITSLAPSEYHFINELKEKGLDIEVYPSRHTVFFENTYSENQNSRSQRVLAKADPFTIQELQKTEARFFHLGSLLSDDFSLDIIKYLSKKGTLSVDAQGYLRTVKGETVFATDWEEKREALTYIDILKVNEYEASMITGCSDFFEAASLLARWGVKEVLLTLGDQGSIVHANGRFYKIPAYPPHQVIDATGCGDTYMLGYLYMRNKGASYEEAGCFAAALSTIKLEKSGPFCGNEKDAMKIIQESDIEVKVYE